MTEQVAKESPTGYLLTQPIVETLSGEHLRLDNLFGDGFAIVASQAEDLELDAEAQTIVDRLGITCTAVHGLQKVKDTWIEVWKTPRRCYCDPTAMCLATPPIHST